MNTIELDEGLNAQENRPISRIKSRQSIHSVSWKWPFLFLAAACVLFYVVHLIDYKLPKVVTEYEAAENPLFSGERARKYLEKLVSVGQRIVGSDENEILTPDIILKELEVIKNSSNPIQSLRYDLQSGSGDYNLEYFPPFTNVYVNVNNVIGKLEGSDGNHSIMLNCHYDSVPSSVGASDDGVSCAIMLELLNVLSKADIRLQHNFIFLFNGAEETPLMAAHLFLKHHWSKDVKAFLNLEAAGAGGRAILFQSGAKNSWLLDYYVRYAPHPHGQVFGEELFQSGAVPSDTDFRIFRDFGYLSGLDFAFSRNGFLYHTIYDRPEYIDTGSIQHSGDNLLSVLRALGNAPELYEKYMYRDGGIVYFDYLGWFMISYSKTSAVFINLLAIALSILSVIIFTKRLSQGQVYKELGFSFVATLGGMVLCVLVSAIMGVIVDGVSAYSIPFYSKTYLLFPLYWIPGILAYILPLVLMNSWREKKRGLSLSLTCQLNLISSQLPFTLLLFVLTCANVRSAHIITINVLFSALANIFIHITQLYRKVHYWIYVYILVHTPSIFVQLYCSLLLYSLFIPILGRSGPINGDLYISVITGFLVIYTGSFVIPLFTLVRRKGFVMGLLLAMNVAIILLCMFSSLGLPYKKGPADPAPQRYWIMHTSRTFYNESEDIRRQDSGYFVLNHDRNSPHTIPAHRKKGLVSLSGDCKTEMFCGLPVFTSRMTVVSDTSSWIPAPVPDIPVTTEIQLVKKMCVQSQCTFNIKIKGPDRKTVFFAPRDSVNLSWWSLDAPLMSSSTWQSRPSYFINIVSGRVLQDFELKLKFDVKQEKQSLPILDIAVAGNHVHHPDKRSSDFVEFLADLPDYVSTTSWISAFKAYVF